MAMGKPGCGSGLAAAGAVEHPGEGALQKRRHARAALALERHRAANLHRRHAHTSGERAIHHALAKAPEVEDREAFLQAIIDRESILSTGIGLGIAVPHAKISSVQTLIAALGKTKRGINYGALDDQPVHIVVMIGANDAQQADYIRALARVTLLLKNEKIREAIVAAESTDKIYETLKEY